MTDKRIRIYFDWLYKKSLGEVALYDFARFLLSAFYYVLRFVHKQERKYKYVYKNNRYINPRYYLRYKHLDFPQGYKWILLTLTLRRDIPLCTAWANIGSWVSSFLHNLRTYFYRKKVKVPYFWVIEPHKDGYPHVHILIAFPFLPIEKIQSWWRWSEPQGVDVRFIGSDLNQVKNYVLKYLLKNQYVDFEVNYKEGYIEFGLIPFLLWYNRVRILGRSRGFILREIKRKSEWVYVGSAHFELDVLYDVRERLDNLKISYDTRELKSVLVAFMQSSSVVLEYPPQGEPEPLDYEIEEHYLDF